MRWPCPGSPVSAISWAVSSMRRSGRSATPTNHQVRPATPSTAAPMATTSMVITRRTVASTSVIGSADGVGGPRIERGCR